MAGHLLPFVSKYYTVISQHIVWHYLIPNLSQYFKGLKTMKNPLDSLWGTVISGLILTIALYSVAQALIK
jgi:hypothetical protein